MTESEILEVSAKVALSEFLERTDSLFASIINTSKKLTGFDKRAFQAKTRQYYESVSEALGHIKTLIAPTEPIDINSLFVPIDLKVGTKDIHDFDWSDLGLL